jgi:hypothetical protein
LLRLDLDRRIDPFQLIRLNAGTGTIVEPTTAKDTIVKAV